MTPWTPSPTRPTAKKPAAAPLSDDDSASFDKLLERIKEVLGQRVADVRVSHRLADSPAVLVSPDGMTSSMEKLMRAMQKDDSLPVKVLEVNRDHALLRSLLKMFKADPQDKTLAGMVENLFDACMLQEGYLRDAQMLAGRSSHLLEQAAAWYVEVKKLTTLGIPARRQDTGGRSSSQDARSRRPAAGAGHLLRHGRWPCPRPCGYSQPGFPSSSGTGRPSVPVKPSRLPARACTQMKESGLSSAARRQRAPCGIDTETVPGPQGQFLAVDVQRAPAVEHQIDLLVLPVPVHERARSPLPAGCCAKISAAVRCSRSCSSLRGASSRCARV